jgi:hypothetical protein
MKTLPTVITKSGFTYRQIERRGNVAVYSQHLKDRAGKPLAYETIIIKEHGAYVLGGNEIPAGESYPGTESFGYLGWSYSSLMPDAKERAFAKMESIIKKGLDKKGQDVETDEVKATKKPRKAK